MPDRLTGKIALVTGIGAGIGQGTALRFAAEGAIVIGCDINPASAEATVDSAREQGLELPSVHPSDLTKPDDAARFVDVAGSEHGRVDVLVNAGAIAPHMAPIDTMDYETQWRPTIAGEVDLVFLACQAAWPHLVSS